MKREVLDLSFPPPNFPFPYEHLHTGFFQQRSRAVSCLWEEDIGGSDRCRGRRASPVLFMSSHHGPVLCHSRPSEGRNARTELGNQKLGMSAALLSISTSSLGTCLCKGKRKLQFSFQDSWELWAPSGTKEVNQSVCPAIQRYIHTSWTRVCCWHPFYGIPICNLCLGMGIILLPNAKIKTDFRVSMVSDPILEPSGCVQSS